MIGIAVIGALSIGFGQGATDNIGLDRPGHPLRRPPMAAFAVLFGLSMDYEVLILSRVREAWLTDGDNTKAIVHGMTASARVITAAAAIVFAVFASFVAGDSTEIKMFGLGLVVAVLLDATVIRLLLVPATMRLLGDANWWIPAWLDRALPNLDIGGAEADEGLNPPPDTVPHRTPVETP